jgi:hypothetical protein
VEGSCEQGDELSGSIKCWEFLSSCKIGSFSRRAHVHEVRIMVSAKSGYNNRLLKK